MLLALNLIHPQQSKRYSAYPVGQHRLLAKARDPVGGGTLAGGPRALEQSILAGGTLAGGPRALEQSVLADGQYHAR